MKASTKEWVAAVITGAVIVALYHGVSVMGVRFIFSILFGVGLVGVGVGIGSLFFVWRFGGIIEELISATKRIREREERCNEREKYMEL